MAREHLGLFDTPPTRREGALALTLVCVVFVGFLATLPKVGHPLGETVAFVPAVSAILFFGELIVASLLYAQAALFRSRALALLAASYVFTALLLIPYAISFPGVFSSGGLHYPGVSTAAWLMGARRFAVPLSIILYGWLKRWDSETPSGVERASPSVLMTIVASCALAIVTVLLATVARDHLPPMLFSRRHGISVGMLAFNGSVIPVLVIAMVMLRRRESVLDLWLLVSLATLLIQSMLNIVVPARFTVGFYALFLLMLISHLVVLLALIAESNRLYVRLAQSTAERSRELDVRMMSMEGVAAAISHEVGQPLTAVSLRASAALAALTREPADPQRAILSLRETVEAAQRAFAVAKSVRAMFGERMSSLSEFDLNELVRESASLLEREMRAQGVVLRLTLEESLPPVVANRVQIQRVLINMLTNAMEALGKVPRRARRIAICSAATDTGMLRVEITDSGAGFTPEDLTQIFEPFFTTKSSGTGLGLSLSRTIVEDHGGRLWASQSEDAGATFHLELPPAPAPPED